MIEPEGDDDPAVERPMADPTREAWDNFLGALVDKANNAQRNARLATLLPEVQLPCPRPSVCAGGPHDESCPAHYQGDVDVALVAAVAADRDRLAERLNKAILRSELEGANSDEWRNGMRRAVLYVTGEIDRGPIHRPVRGNT